MLLRAHGLLRSRGSASPMTAIDTYSWNFGMNPPNLSGVGLVDAAGSIPVVCLPCQAVNGRHPTPVVRAFDPERQRSKQRQ